MHEHLEPAAAVVHAQAVLGEDDRADGEAGAGRRGRLRGRAEVQMPGAPRPLGVPHADDGIAVVVDALLEERERAARGEGVVLQRLAVVDVDLEVDDPRAEGGEQRVARGDRRPVRQAQAEAGRDQDDTPAAGPAAGGSGQGSARAAAARSPCSESRAGRRNLTRRGG